MDTISKFLAALPAAVIGVGLAFGVDVSTPVELIAAAVATLTPIIVYAVRNRGLPAASADKAIVTIGSTVVGVALFFGLDVSAEVAKATGTLLSLTPLLVYITPND